MLNPPSRFMLFVLVPGLLLVGGCASYVNIPPDSKDTAFNSVNTVPVPGIVAASMAFAVEQFPVDAVAFGGGEGGVEAAFDATFGVVLPEGAGSRLWGMVLDRVPENAVPMTSELEAQGSPVYRLIAVRIRGNKAMVDVILPEEAVDDARRLLELRLESGFTGWRVASHKRTYLPMEPDAG